MKYVGFPKVNCKPAHLFQRRLSEYLIWKVPSQNSKECVFYLILVSLVFVYFVLCPSKWERITFNVKDWTVLPPFVCGAHSRQVEHFHVSFNR